MSKERASLGFGDELDGFNMADWTPATPKNNNRPKAESVEKAAVASGFRSREPKAAKAPVAPVVPAKPVAAPILPEGQGGQLRRRRTGRNAQFNLKAKPETIEAFCAIADRKGWGLGETLEHAVAALLERDGRTS